jgi:hypothetical protein
MLVCIFIGPFFSYTFPIVVAPIMLLLFITFLFEGSNRNLSLKPMLPLIVFALALTINYFTDLQFVLSDKGQYHNFDTFVMNYKSIGLMGKGLLNIAWLFTSIFFFDKSYSFSFLCLLYFIKILVLIFSLLGLYHVIENQVKKIKRENGTFLKSLSFSGKPGIQFFFLLLFMATIFLYLIKMLPLGTHRINYFCVIYITYFVITGFSYTMKKLPKLKYLLLPAIVFAASFPAMASDINELKNTNLDFDQKIYDNVGKAINTAKADSLPIVVAFNEFYPKSLVKGTEGLMIKSHHAYKPKDSIQVYVCKNGELDSLLRCHHLSNFVLVKKYSYKIFPDN